MTITRRDLLRSALATTVVGAVAGHAALPPVRAITTGPKFHWFGYYDKLQFDPSSRYALGMELDFQGRTPLPTDTIRLGMIDTEEGDRWSEIGTSYAWCWQQGCMLQWIPGSKSEVIWNDREGGRFVTRILDVRTGKRRTLPQQFYCLSLDGRTALATDLARVHDTYAGYGYAGVPDPNRDVAAPRDSGVWRMDLATGESRLLFSIYDVLQIPFPFGYPEGAKHWLLHLLFSPDGSRFAFLHRWRVGNESLGPFWTRMITADCDGKDLYEVDPSGETSHFIWRDPEHILAWTWRPYNGERFYLLTDKTDRAMVVGPDVMTKNGHCSYLPGNRYILNDTYPDEKRLQHVYLYEVATGRRLPLGDFYSSPSYMHEFRCDTHPRFSPDGRKVVIDSPHGGDGRQMYLLNI